MPDEFSASHDRRGIARLRWLQENADDLLQRDPPMEVRRSLLMSEAEVQIEVATAIIEELHDFLLELRHPAYVITGGEPSSTHSWSPP